MMSLISGMQKEDKAANKLRKKDVGMAKVSLAIVFIFIICHSIKWIPNIYELSHVSHSIPYIAKTRMHVLPIFIYSTLQKNYINCYIAFLCLQCNKIIIWHTVKLGYNEQICVRYNLSLAFHEFIISLWRCKVIASLYLVVIML